MTQKTLHQEWADENAGRVYLCATCQSVVPPDQLKKSKNPVHRCYCSNSCRAFAANRPKLNLYNLHVAYLKNRDKDQCIDSFIYAGRAW